MSQANTTRFTAVLLLSAGFICGAIAAAGCGGSGGAAFAAGGSTTVVHSKTLAAPVTFTTDFMFTAEFTPSDPNARVLAVEVLGELETGGADVIVSAVAIRSFDTHALGGAITATFNATAPLSITAPYALSTGFPAGPTIEVGVFMSPVVNGFTNTINSLTLRIVTTEGVMVMDPSPRFL